MVLPTQKGVCKQITIIIPDSSFMITVNQDTLLCRLFDSPLELSWHFFAWSSLVSCVRYTAARALVDPSPSPSGHSLESFTCYSILLVA